MLTEDIIGYSKFLASKQDNCPYCSYVGKGLGDHLSTEHSEILKVELPKANKPNKNSQNPPPSGTRLDEGLVQQETKPELQVSGNESPNDVGLAENAHTPEGMDEEDNYEDIAAGVKEVSLYVCPVCGEEFYSEKTLDDHTLSEHSEMNDDEEIETDKADYEDVYDEPVHHTYQYMSEGENYYKGRRSRGIYGEIATQRRRAQEARLARQRMAGTFNQANGSKVVNHRIVYGKYGVLPVGEREKAFYGIYCTAGDMDRHMSYIEALASKPYNEQRKFFESIPDVEQNAMMRIGEEWDKHHSQLAGEESSSSRAALIDWYQGFKELVDRAEHYNPADLERERATQGKLRSAGRSRTANKPKNYKVLNNEVSMKLMNDLWDKYKRNTEKGIIDAESSPELKELYKIYIDQYYNSESPLHGITFREFLRQFRRVARDEGADEYVSMIDRARQELADKDEEEIARSEKVRHRILESRDRRADRARELDEQEERVREKPKAYWVIGEDGKPQRVEEEQEKPIITSRSSDALKEAYSMYQRDAYDLDTRKFKMPFDEYVSKMYKTILNFPRVQGKKHLLTVFSEAMHELRGERKSITKFNYQTEVSDMVKSFVDKLRYRGTVGDEWECPYDKAVFVTPDAMGYHLLNRHSDVITKLMKKVYV